tara:strand:- start:85 stop:372 length:288 start_codon:yes stop_codon:yes gene_type:complete
LTVAYNAVFLGARTGWTSKTGLPSWIEDIIWFAAVAVLFRIPTIDCTLAKPSVFVALTSTVTLDSITRAYAVIIVVIIPLPTILIENTGFFRRAP